MKKPYFVMLRTHGEGILPFINEDDNVAQFETEEEAREAGKDNVLGEACGFEVFNMNEGL